jgi:hypothetical protein
VDLIHGAIVTTCGFAILFRTLQLGNVVASANAIEVRFGILALLMFAVSWASTDQANPYHPRLAVLDTIEALMMVQYFNLLGLFPQTPREGMPRPGSALIALAIVLAIQMLWRKWANLRLEPEHWDYRFLMIAAAGGAWAASGLIQLLFIAVSGGVVVAYVRARHNAALGNGGKAHARAG